VPNRFTPSVLLALLAGTSILAACGGGGGSLSPIPQRAPEAAQPAQADTLSTARTADGFGRIVRFDDHGSDLSANPMYVNFTASQNDARAAQTVTVTASGSLSEQNVTAAMVGIGDCPALSSSKLTFTQRNGKLQATLTVTARGRGPALCAITVARHDEDHSRGGHDCDGDLVIPVIVDCGNASTPTPAPTPTPTPPPTATPTPTPTPAPTPTAVCTQRQC
jgi:hypothetical protein